MDVLECMHRRKMELRNSLEQECDEEDQREVEVSSREKVPRGELIVVYSSLEGRLLRGWDHYISAGKKHDRRKIPLVVPQEF